MSRRSKVLSLSFLALGAAAALAQPFFSSTPEPAVGAPVATKLAPAGESRAYLQSRNLPAHGVAIEGFSPVSYFEGQAERGSALFSVEHDGVTYHLTSAAQVATFAKDPAKYVPAYGGWCAFGMAVQDKFPIDPTNFRIVGGELLLFLRNSGVDAGVLWDKGNESKQLRKAEAHWRKVQG